jgi:MFS family permease
MARLSKSLSFGLSGNLLTLFYAIFLWELGFGLYINNLLTVYLEDHGMSPARVGLVLTLAGLGRILLLLPVGSLMDHVGRKPIIVFAAAIAVPGALGYVFFTNQWLLAACTIVMSINALGFPAMSGIIADSNAENPTDVFRKLYTVGPAIAFIIGPTVGGKVGQEIGNRAVFAVAAVVFTGALILSLRLHEPPMSNRGTRRGGYNEIIAYRPLRWTVLFAFTLVFTLSFGVTFLPNLLTDRYHFTDLQRGVAFSFGAIGTLGLSLLMARVPAITHIRGSALGVLSVTGVCLAVLVTGNPWVIIPAFMMRGGFMLSWSLLTPLANDIAPRNLKERTFAGIEFSTGIGNTLAPVLAGLAYEFNQLLPFVIGAITMPMVAAAAIVLERKVINPTLAKTRAAAAATETIPEPAVA